MIDKTRMDKEMEGWTDEEKKAFRSKWLSTPDEYIPIVDTVDATSPGVPPEIASQIDYAAKSFEEVYQILVRQKRIISDQNAYIDALQIEIGKFVERAKAV